MDCLQLFEFALVMAVEGDDDVVDVFGSRPGGLPTSEVAVCGFEAKAILIMSEDGAAERLFTLGVALAL